MLSQSLIEKLNNKTITYHERLNIINIIKKIIENNEKIIKILEKTEK